MSKESGPRFFISVDMEGISGIVDWSQVGRDPTEYEKGKDLMLGDVNAAIEGILDKTEADIVVSDAHGAERCLDPEKLHKAALHYRGSPKPITQMTGIGPNFDAALFIGYHPMRGTKHGILDHTISGSTIESIVINGKKVGETGINAAIAGYYEVPLIFLSGDLAVTKEAKKIVPNIVTVAVKEAVGRNAANCIHPELAREKIRLGVKEALEKRNMIKPFVFEAPIKAEVKYISSVMADAVEFMPMSERIDGKTVRFVLNDYIKAFRAVRASIWIAGAVLS
jgi:D-amino peptidase